MEQTRPQLPPARGLLGRRISPETGWIAALCMIDLLTTLYWIAMGQAREGNPFLDYFLQLGSWHFILAKLATFIPALVVAEWWRPHNPRLIVRLQRWVIVGYVVIYLVGVLGHNARVLEFYKDLLGL